jgi:ferrous iron transport protein A
LLLSLIEIKSQFKGEEMNLSQLKPGETAKITRISIKGELKRRLKDMGVTKGELVKVEKVAPLETR